MVGVVAYKALIISHSTQFITCFFQELCIITLMHDNTWYTYDLFFVVLLLIESLKCMLICGSDLLHSFSIPGFWIPDQVGL